jgi:hypothetical protein
VWCEHLQLERVGVFDLFLDLGGHSLLAMQIIEAIEQRTGVRFVPGDLATHNLAQLAERCDQLQQRTTSPSRARGILSRILRR